METQDNTPESYAALQTGDKVTLWLVVVVAVLAIVGILFGKKIVKLFLI